MSTILITGGHSGIGLAAVRELAAKGNDIVLAGRGSQRMQPTADELRMQYGVSVTMLELDTSSLESVRDAVAQFRKLREAGEVEPLGAIICNAGGRFDGEVSYSPDGYETTFATNCLGHFLLVELLLPSLVEGGRVLYTASGTHDSQSIDGKRSGPPSSPTPRRWRTTARTASGRSARESATAPRSCAR